MADKAHRLTDEKLEEMEERLSAIYSRAEKEIQQTADEYFSKFAKQDESKRKLVEQGKMTEDEYKKWRKGKVMYGKRFTEMKEQCAKQLLNVNQTALAYVNGELPEVYAINYNALASSVDGVGGYSFTLVDADTVRNLAVTDTSLLPYKDLDPAKDIPWNMKKINAETLQGILQGESMDKIAKRLRNVQEMNKTQAIRSARTLVTGAENKGRQDSYARAEAAVTISANSGYELPDAITVSGASYTWDKSTGTVVLSNPTSNVTITVVAVEAKVEIINLLDTAGYKNNTRLSASNAAEKTQSGHVATGYIYVGDVVKGDVIRTKGIDFTYGTYPNQGVIAFFNADKTFAGVSYANTPRFRQFLYEMDDSVNLTLTCDLNKNAETWCDYMRFSGVCADGANAIITKNQPIE